jgi:excisionase family DNA binding protein
MKDLVLISREDLRALIIESVNECLNAQTKKQHRFKDSEPIEARITKKQAAALINCSVSTIDNARRAGKITAYRIGGKAVRFEKSEVLNLAKK